MIPMYRPNVLSYMNFSLKCEESELNVENVGQLTKKLGQSFYKRHPIVKCVLFVVCSVAATVTETCMSVGCVCVKIKAALAESCGVWGTRFASPLNLGSRLVLPALLATI